LKPEAKAAADRFDRWDRHDVLPTIRNTGSYATAAISGDNAAVLAAAVATAVAGAMTPVLERISSMTVEGCERLGKRIVAKDPAQGAADRLQAGLYEA
jgi:hypothetical protein